MMLFKNRKRRKQGSSMILALVFLLFCTFVGGSILAASTANAARITHLSDEQDYLDHRSACLLLVDELKPSAGKQALSLKVFDNTTKTQEVAIVNGGGVEHIAGAPVTTKRTIQFSIPGGVIDTPMKRVLYETAVLRYLKINGLKRDQIRNTTSLVKITSFNYNGDTVNKLEDFWCWDLYQDGTDEIKGTVDVTGNLGSYGEFPKFEAYFSSNFHTKKLFDFDIDFGTYSQMKVHAPAVTGNSAHRYNYISAASSKYYSNDVVSNITDVTWRLPAISKGGV